MVGKISSGKYASGIFEYLEREKSEIIDKNMSGETKEELTKEFLMNKDLNQNVEKPVKHHVISFAPEDKGKLTDEQRKELVQDYVEKSGYTNNQYVAYLHRDTKQDHVHIVINKIDRDGKNCHPKYEKKQARKTLMELEDKYDLRRTPEKSLQKDVNHSQKMEDRLHDKGKSTDKENIKGLVNETLDRKVWNKEEFEKLLKKSGVEVKMNSAKNGYKFAYKGREYKASSIDRNLSFKKINERLEENKMQRRQQSKDLGLSLG